MKTFLTCAVFVNVVFALWNYNLGNYATVGCSIYVSGVLTPTLYKVFVKNK